MGEVAKIERGQPLLARMSDRFGVDPDRMLDTLKATAFKGQVSNEQMMALLIVAEQYKLNPWTKEIYAFPDSRNGIVPVVGVDGWSRIINEHPQFDGMDFEQDDQSCACVIHRKDRTHPIRVTEYMAECRRDTAPWKSHPRRMLRHKAMIQCARIAFGYTGIYDEDEADRIVNVTAQSERITDEPDNASIAADHDLAIRDAADLDSLKRAFAAAYTWAQSIRDKGRMETFKSLYDERKAAMEAPAAEEQPE